MTENNKQQFAVSRTMSLFRTPQSASRTSERGFTLIELAIVLVIIGIILGAVMKGQDLITSARTKKFVTQVKLWEIDTWSFYDKMGRFPGDIDKSGIIGDGASDTAANSSGGYELNNSGLSNPPSNPINFGAANYYVYLGNDGQATKRNVLVICTIALCGTGTALSQDDLNFIQQLDTNIDGSADAGVGRVRSATTVPTVNANGVVTLAAPTVTTSAGTATPWAAGTHTALVYYFDKPL